MTVVVSAGGEPEPPLAPEPPGDRVDPWVRVRRWASLAAAVLVVALAVTGVVLHYEYRPTAEQGWPGLVELAGDPEPGTEQPARRVHRAASQLLLPVALVLAVAGIGAARSRRSGRRGTWVLPIAVPSLALVGSFTGYLLPWDQLALWSVTVGSDIDGMSVAMSDQVRFVIIGGVEVSTATLRRWYVVHVVVAVGLAAAVVPGLLAWRRR